MMSRSNSLRRLIMTNLKTVCNDVYYKRADDDKIYPHVVFNLMRANTGDLSRKDFIVAVDIWDKDNQERNEEHADAVEDAFSNKNMPQEDILPTFFTESRRNVEDEDKSINHIQVEISVQLYEKER